MKHKETLEIVVRATGVRIFFGDKSGSGTCNRLSENQLTDAIHKQLYYRKILIISPSFASLNSVKFTGSLTVSGKFIG